MKTELSESVVQLAKAHAQTSGETLVAIDPSSTLGREILRLSVAMHELRDDVNAISSLRNDVKPNSPIPSETLAWMDSVKIEEMQKPFTHHGRPFGGYYSTEYLASTPLAVLKEKHAKFREMYEEQDPTPINGEFKLSSFSTDDLVAEMISRFHPKKG